LKTHYNTLTTQTTPNTTHQKTGTNQKQTNSKAPTTTHKKQNNKKHTHHLKTIPTTQTDYQYKTPPKYKKTA
jgi:hypothetical protein